MPDGHAESRITKSGENPMNTNFGGMKRIEADAAMTQQVGDIVETKFANPHLGDGVNEELNQL
jgi:hypothetical protein